MTDLTNRIIELGSLGRARRPEAAPSAEEVLCGLVGTDEGRWALKIVVSLYDHHRASQPYQVGDRVRVREEYWYLGLSRGWDGFAPMFADETGEVIDVQWSPSNLAWCFLVQYENSYRWSDSAHGDGGRIYLHEKPDSFMFWAEYLQQA